MSTPGTPEATSAPVRDLPLSYNQEFVCLFDHGDGSGPFSPRYHIVHGWRLRGRVDVDALQGALDDLVERHEALRTLLVRTGDGLRQEVHPACPPRLEVRDLSGTAPQERRGRVEELLNEVEATTLDARELPHLRAVLGRFDSEDSLLVLVVHHTLTDGWSVRLIIRELATLYALRRGHALPGLPEAPQYREHTLREREETVEAARTAARERWRTMLEGAHITAIPTDRPRSAGLAPRTSVYRFAFDEDLVRPLLRTAKATRSTPFMVLLTAYKVLVHRRTGATDVVVPTFTPGRGTERAAQTVGPFFNFLPLRTGIAGCRTFRDVVARVRAACVEAYAYEIPSVQIFAQAPRLMLPALEDRAAPVVFQVFPFPFVLDREVVGDLEYSEVVERRRSQSPGSDVPDGALWTLNVLETGKLFGSVQFRDNLFDESTISGMVAEFHRILRGGVDDPDAPVESL